MSRTIDHLEAEIRALLSDATNQAKIAAVLKTLSGEREEKAEKSKRLRSALSAKQPPVLRYISVRRNYTCTHCGARYTSEVSFLPTETIPGIDERGKITIINAKTPAEINLLTGFCENCSTFVENLSRGELEERYIEMLKRKPFPTELYVQNLNKGEREEEVEVRL
jgi:hypothetical protein